MCEDVLAVLGRVDGGEDLELILSSKESYCAPDSDIKLWTPSLQYLVFVNMEQCNRPVLKNLCS